MAARGASEIGTAPAPAAAGWVEVGRVLRPSGRDGALLVGLYGEDVSNLLDAERVRLEGSRGEIPFRIRGVRAAGTGALGARARLWLEGLADLKRAAAWRGARVSLPEAALKPLPQGEFYWRQIIGLRARLADGRHLGRRARGP